MADVCPIVIPSGTENCHRAGKSFRLCQCVRPDCKKLLVFIFLCVREEALSRKDVFLFLDAHWHRTKKSVCGEGVFCAKVFCEVCTSSVTMAHRPDRRLTEHLGGGGGGGGGKGGSQGCTAVPQSHVRLGDGMLHCCLGVTASLPIRDRRDASRTLPQSAQVCSRKPHRQRLRLRSVPADRAVQNQPRKTSSLCDGKFVRNSVRSVGCFHRLPTRGSLSLSEFSWWKSTIGA